LLTCLSPNIVTLGWGVSTYEGNYAKQNLLSCPYTHLKILVLFSHKTTKYTKVLIGNLFEVLSSVSGKAKTWIAFPWEVLVFYKTEE
jgi:hypothetical protein